MQAMKMQSTLSVSPAAGFVRPIAPRRLARRFRRSRSLAWHLAAELALLASSGGYAAYALLHLSR